MSRDPDLADLQPLARTFGISLEVCSRRIVDLLEECFAVVFSKNGVIRYSHKGANFPWINLSRGDKFSSDNGAGRAIAKARRGRTTITEANAAHWLQNSDITLHEHTRVGNDGFAATLLWAELPDDEDGGLAELDAPRFR